MKCQRYEIQENAYSLTDITTCNPKEVQAIVDKAVELSSGEGAGQEVTVGGSTALKLDGVAAVGGATLSALTMASEEECLAACALWSEVCTRVTVGKKLKLLLSL